MLEHIKTIKVHNDSQYIYYIPTKEIHTLINIHFDTVFRFRDYQADEGFGDINSITLRPQSSIYHLNCTNSVLIGLNGTHSIYGPYYLNKNCTTKVPVVSPLHDQSYLLLANRFCSSFCVFDIQQEHYIRRPPALDQPMPSTEHSGAFIFVMLFFLCFLCFSSIAIERVRKKKKREKSISMSEMSDGGYETDKFVNQEKDEVDVNLQHI